MFRRPRERVSGWLKTVRRRDSRYPPAPEGLILYAIGDIHGRSDCLERAHDLIDRDVVARASRGRTQEIYIGDYVDRGPDSKGVINRLIARSSATSIVALRGNHEIIMESFLCEQTPFDDWRRLGGTRDDPFLRRGRAQPVGQGRRPASRSRREPSGIASALYRLIKKRLQDWPVLFRSCRNPAWRRNRATVDGRPCLDPRRLLEFSRTFRIYRRPWTHARDERRISKQQN